MKIGRKTGDGSRLKFSHLSQMKLARPEEIDDRTKTARVPVKVELIVLEKTNSTKNRDTPECETQWILRLD